MLALYCALSRLGTGQPLGSMLSRLSAWIPGACLCACVSVNVCWTIDRSSKLSISFVLKYIGVQSTGPKVIFKSLQCRPTYFMRLTFGCQCAGPDVIFWVLGRRLYSIEDETPFCKPRRSVAWRLIGCKSTEHCYPIVCCRIKNCYQSRSCQKWLVSMLFRKN